MRGQKKIVWVTTPLMLSLGYVLHHHHWIIFTVHISPPLFFFFRFSTLKTLIYLGFSPTQNQNENDEKTDL